MEKYGFVYIWRDRKYNRYYIGSHWGLENDNYICSSNWMRHSYKRRPKDFKRRILTRVYTNRKDLLIEEQRWLSMIKPEEIKIRYYNINLDVFDPWWSNEESRLTVGEKVSKAKKGKNTGPRDPSIGQKISKAKKAKFQELRETTGSAFSEEHKAKMSENRKGKKHTEEWKAENSKRLKQQWASGERTYKNGVTDETRKKLSELHKGRKYPKEFGEKISQALKGKPGTNTGKKFSEETKAKMAEARRLHWTNRKEELSIAFA